MDYLLYLLIILIVGFTHGLEPGHGWPIAMIYSLDKENKSKWAFLSSSLIAIAHFVSSIVAVIIFVILNEFILFEPFLLNLIALILLIIMAILSLIEYFRKKGEIHIDHTHDTEFEREHNHIHSHEGIGEHTHFHRHFTNKALTLKGIVLFAFLLGFAHEEEFALLGIALAGVNPYLLMVFYGIGVFSAMVGITMLSLRFYQLIRTRIKSFDKCLPVINFISFAILAILVLIDLL